ncbi:MAG: alginate export family protein [Candidatus Omnitrophica bacterium]|nr:alginate export family protein [Candidatus Omnitrophota bacterium]
MTSAEESHVTGWQLLVAVTLGCLGCMGIAAAAEEAGLKAMDHALDQAATPITRSDGMVTVKFGGELRYRLELRDDFNFNDAAYEDDAIHLLRTRLQADATAGSCVRAFVQGQDAESFAGSGLNRTNGFIDRLDLRQLFVELTSPVEALPATLKVGRQELAYGEQRFVGAFDWSNVTRVFDAVKVSWTPTTWAQVDSWFSQVVLVDRVRPDSADHGDNFYGLYTSLKPMKDHVVDAFLFIRHDRDNELRGEIASRRGQLKEYALGNRLRGKRARVDYGLEWAWQFGSRAHEDIEAWAWHNELGYTFAEVPWSPRLGMEYNHGSGDDNASDGKVGNFDNLFPTNHLHYGYIDFASLRNLDHLEANLTAKPVKPLTLVTKYHWFFLDTNKSAWFNAGQGVIRAAGVNASRTLGQEVDLLAKCQVSKHVDALTGYSHFHAGAFAQDTGAGDDANFFYWQTTVKF